MVNGLLFCCLVNKERDVSCFLLEKVIPKYYLFSDIFPTGIPIGIID